MVQIGSWSWTVKHEALLEAAGHRKYEGRRASTQLNPTKTRTLRDSNAGFSYELQNMAGTSEPVAADSRSWACPLTDFLRVSYHWTKRPIVHGLDIDNIDQRIQRKVEVKEKHQYFHKGGKEMNTESR